MVQLFRLLKRSLLKAIEHDQFGIAKGAAYSAILTLFPAALLVASILVASQSTEAFVREISYGRWPHHAAGHPLADAGLFYRRSSPAHGHADDHLGSRSGRPPA